MDKYREATEDAWRDDGRARGCESYEAELDYLDDLIDDIWEIRLGERRLSDAESRYLRRRYADEVAHADAVLGRIMDSLSQHGLYDGTLVILTANQRASRRG